MDFIEKVFRVIFVDEILVFIPLSVIFFYSIFYFIEKKFSSFTVLILLLPFFYIFYQYSYLPNFFSSIGQDSLTELNADLGEAVVDQFFMHWGINIFTLNLLLQKETKKYPRF